jgi:hypothetical protein
MKDLEIHLENRPGALAEMGEALAKAGISIEGGGTWVAGNTGVAHFLLEATTTARDDWDLHQRCTITKTFVCSSMSGLERKKTSPEYWGHLFSACFWR